MIDISRIKVGDKVHYIPFKGCDISQIQNGKIKEILEFPNPMVRVVYNCEEQWDKYMDYTSELTSVKDLEYGWEDIEAEDKINLFEPGDVFQINQNHGRNGWIGAFVLSTEITKWGINGFVHLIKTHNEMACAFIRLEWKEIDYVGPAVLISKEE